ncbi:hypothetical protein EJ110_NYTH53680 [Nymphaea thermarum]|nr:hypothetical protein EJ110_NYTH53680 [Nymphaea thermarum]
MAFEIRLSSDHLLLVFIRLKRRAFEIRLPSSPSRFLRLKSLFHSSNDSVESHIAPIIAYYTKAKDMLSFLRNTYSHATNVVKILQLEEELCNIRQGDQDLSQYFATLTAAYERLKALRPLCQHCYASHFQTDMVEKFLYDLSSEYSVAKSQILIGSDLSDLADTYNRLSRLAATLSQNTHDRLVSTLVILGGRGPSSFGGTRGRGAGRDRFQCSYCGKIGHLEDLCWDKHPHLRLNVSSRRGGVESPSAKISLLPFARASASAHYIRKGKRQLMFLSLLPI